MDARHFPLNKQQHNTTTTTSILFNSQKVTLKSSFICIFTLCLHYVVTSSTTDSHRHVICEGASENRTVQLSVCVCVCVLSLILICAFFHFIHLLCSLFLCLFFVLFSLFFFVFVVVSFTLFVFHLD